jgi:hypothetical protein
MAARPEWQLFALTGFPYVSHAKKGQGHPGRPVAKTKGYHMKNLIARLRVEAEKRAKFRHIRDEIAAMPRDVAIDLGIFPEDAARLAHKAVWG